MKRLVGLFLAFAVLSVASTLALAAGDQDEGERGEITLGGPYHPYDTLPCTGSEESANFEVFSLGENPNGLRLEQTLRRCDNPQPYDAVTANYVSYVYGSCDLSGSEREGCQPPLEIQSWPACQRSNADYIRDGKPMPSERLPDIDSALVHSFDGGNRLEIYSGATTIVVFSTDVDQARAALSKLTRQDPEASVSELMGGSESDLKAPVDGAMEGELKCA